MRRRNKVRNFKKQDDQLDLILERPASFIGLIGSLQEDVEKVDVLVADFEKELGM